VRLLNGPYRLLFPAILVFCLIGIYTVNNSTTDVLLTAVFAVLGYLLAKFGLEPAPLVLGFILGPLMEENLRRSMVLSRGDPMIFLTRPISLVLLLMSAAVVLLVALPQFRKTRETAFQE
jgi:putative tricarboxylic transport membrane protein